MGAHGRSVKKQLDTEDPVLHSNRSANEMSAVKSIHSSITGPSIEVFFGQFWRENTGFTKSVITVPLGEWSLGA